MAAPETGRTQLNRQLVEGAATLAGPAADLASGAGALRTASNFLKDAALDKLLGPTAVFAGSLVGVLRTVRSIVRESGVLEKGLRRIASVQGITGKFETLMKSATAAKGRIEELYRFTARSPFDFGDVAEANRILQALTRGAFASTEAMKMVGDMAAATGSDMASAADKVAKLYAALSSGRSLDKIIFQLQMSGVVTDELAGKLEALEASGASFSSKWAEVEKVIGRTTGGMKNEMDTLDALSTRFNNANAAMAQAFAEPYVEAQVKAMKLMIAATENLTPLVAEVGRDFSILPNFIRDAKNGLLDTFAASHRFADALRVAYRVAVSLFVGLAGATAIMAARNLTALGSAALATAQGMRTAYAAAILQTKAQAGLAAASALSTAASEAFAKGELLSAAALKAKSLWLGLTTRALTVNAIAARAAGAGTAAYSVGAHAANLATAGLAGAAKLAGKGLVLVAGLARGAAVAMLSNPWTAAALAVFTAGAALFKWAAAAKQAAQESRELAESIRDTTKRLDEQSAAVKSLTDWQASVEKLRQRYRELADEVVAFNRRVAQGEEPSDADISAHMKNVAERRQVRTALDKELRRNTRNLDLSDGEKDGIRQDQAEQRAARDRAFRLAFSAADTPEQRLALLDARKAELESRVRDGRTAKAGEREALRNGGAAFRMHLEQKRDDLAAKYDQREDLIAIRRDAAMENAGAKKNEQGTWEGVTVSPEALDIFNEAEKELRKVRGKRKVAMDTAEEDIRNIDLTSASPTVRAQAQLDEAVRLNKGPAEIGKFIRALDDARAAVAGLADAENELAELVAQESQEMRDLGRLRATQHMTNEYDGRINAARAAGDPTAGLEFEKAMALAEVERNDAKSPEEAQAAQAKIDGMNADREARRREVERQRARNLALAGGDRKRAVAIDDAAALREKINEYAGLGLSAEQATADFRGGLVADAAGRQPSIIADSMAAIGGGGRAFQAVDPAIAAQERAARAAEQAAKDAAAVRSLLAEIRDSVREED